jgi:hypothetical protein
MLINMKMQGGCNIVAERGWEGIITPLDRMLWRLIEVLCLGALT